MLSSLGLLGTLLVLALAFIVIQFGSKWILSSDWAASYTNGKGWAGLLNITTGVQAILAFLVLLPFIGFTPAIGFAVVIGIVEYILGYWRSTQRVPSITGAKLEQAFNWVSLVQNLSYTGIASALVKWFLAAKFGITS